MPPSYPNWEWASDLSIRFLAPNKRIVYKIFDDSEEEEFLRKKAAGMILYGRVKKLARALSRHRIRIETVMRNELEIVLFLPPPPCPPPKPRSLKERRMRYALRPQLETIKEIPEENVAAISGGIENPTPDEWITLYQYLPAEKRDAMCADF